MCVTDDYLNKFLRMNKFHVNVIWHADDKATYHFFSLSKHNILCKKGTVNIKKSNYEIFAHLYILKYPKFIFSIFTVFM